MWWNQTFQHLNGAVQALIIGDAPLCDRLEAAINRISLIPEQDFPLTLRKELHRLMDKIEAYHQSSNPREMESDLALAIFALFKKFMVEAWPPTIPLDDV